MDNSISVIIPYFNSNVKLLERALLSVFNQTDKDNVDIVICDDGSDNQYQVELKRILSKYNFPISLVTNEVNMGIAVARNNAVKQCKGNWLVWLDSDDELFPETISVFRDNVDGSCFDYFITKCIVLENGKVEYREPKIYFLEYQKLKESTQNPFISNIFSVQAQMIKKDVFLEIGGFEAGLKYAEVTEFFLRYVWKKGTDHLKYIDKYLYKYYRNEGSHSTDRENLEKQRAKILFNYARLYKLDVTEIRYTGRNCITGAQEYILN
ncbi:MAG: glycosyltransferase [Carboxylicivirga sp.]|jgi:glycosyltransferase involved in cell wall biosynthesis|nr:glycosyltransferase [Carboxylicivirga sp.]